MRRGNAGGWWDVNPAGSSTSSEGVTRSHAYQLPTASTNGLATLDSLVATGYRCGVRHGGRVGGSLRPGGGAHPDSRAQRHRPGSDLDCVLERRHHRTRSAWRRESGRRHTQRCSPPRAAGCARGRRPRVLQPWWVLSHRCGSCGVEQREWRLHPGGLHDYPAVRQERLPVAGEVTAAQSQGTRALGQARDHREQGSDPGRLPQHRVLRAWRLRN
ncbi:unannotated protein [freshwater metagenome]|uniref:Unannotated protein n=1 Tax=freshwater metagenome TaxID=449393 RepID=A0A6J7NKD2_9ZZZZ